MLPRAARLLNRRDFRAAYSRSQSFSTSRLVLYVKTRRRSQPADSAVQSPLRVGYSISRKTCRKAHDRNLLKRRMREITRLDVLPHIRASVPLDVVVVGRSQAPEASFGELRADLLRLFKQAGVTEQ